MEGEASNKNAPQLDRNDVRRSMKGKKSGPIKLRRGKNADSATDTQPPKRRGRPKKSLPMITSQVQENAVFQDKGKSFEIIFMLMFTVVKMMFILFVPRLENESVF